MADKDFNLLTTRRRRFTQAAIVLSGALILVFIELGFIVPMESEWTQHITVGLVIAAAIFVGATLLLFIDRRTTLEKMLRNSEEKYRTLTENSLTGIFILSSMKIAYANKELTSITGISKKDLIGKSPDVLIYPEDLDMFRFREQNRIDGGSQPSNYELRLRTSSGEPVWCEIVANMVHFEDKLSVLANLIDITEKKKRRARLDAVHRVSESLLTSKPVEDIHNICLDTIMELLDADAGLIYTIDGIRLELSLAKGVSDDFIQANQTMEIEKCLIGRAAVEKVCYKISDAEDYKGLLPFAAPNDIYNSFVIVPILFEDEAIGSSAILSQKKNFFKDEDVSVIESISDQMGSAITREMLLKKLEHQARHDPLTGLYNRRYFNEQVQQMITARRTFGNRVTFLMIDIDRFKEINDTYGHLKGDEVLKAVASILRHSVSDDEILVRFGGDEFLVILPEGRKPESISETMNQEMKDLNDRMDEIEFHLDLSIGIAVWDRKMVRNIEDIIHQADEMMYRSKKGKSCE